MAPPKMATASPTPAPSATAPPRNRVADALYGWATLNFSPGDVLSQDDLTGAGIIPNSDLKILLGCVEYLVKKSLFRVHDKAGGGIGWELVDPEVAKNYAGLNLTEHLVLQVVQDASNAGIWTKVVQTKTNIPQGKLDKIFKALEGRGLITAMKGVAHPSRKMYIITGLTPSDEATGGSWFSEGVLDQGMITAVSGAIEVYVSNKSWQEVSLEDVEDSVPGQKRKQPTDGFEEYGDDRLKITKTVEAQHKTKHSKHHTSTTSYQPFAPGYQSYPTLDDISRNIYDTGVIAAPLPQNAIAQLLQVMVYDDRLFKVSRPARPNELADDFTNKTTTMYRCFKNPSVLTEKRSLAKRMMSQDQNVRIAAYRQDELEALGPGGTSEVPCMRCPVFDICGDGGQVNATTCTYFTEWYDKIGDAEKDAKERNVKERKTKERDKSHMDKGKGKEKELPPHPNGDRGPTIEVELEEPEPS